MVKLLSILIILAICSCERQARIHSVNEGNEAYPIVIDSLHMQKQYDLAKWTLYCIHSTDTLKIPNDTNRQIITLGELPLRFDTVYFRNDTSEIDFRFYYQDTILVDGRLATNAVTWGTMFKGNDENVVRYSSFGNSSFYVTCDFKDCPDRFVNPLQPEVVAYLNQNRKKVNPWFLNEAKKRNVIK